MKATCLGEHRGHVCAVRETCRAFWRDERALQSTPMRISLCPLDEHGTRTMYEPQFIRVEKPAGARSTDWGSL